MDKIFCIAQKNVDNMADGQYLGAWRCYMINQIIEILLVVGDDWIEKADNSQKEQLVKKLEDAGVINQEILRLAGKGSKND